MAKLHISTPTLIFAGCAALGFLAMPFLPDPNEDWTLREEHYSTAAGLARYAEVAVPVLAEAPASARAPTPGLRVVVNRERVDVDDIGWFLALPDDAQDAIAQQGSTEIRTDGTVDTTYGVPSKQVAVAWVQELVGDGPSPAAFVALVDAHRARQNTHGGAGVASLVADVAAPPSAVARLVEALDAAGLATEAQVQAGTALMAVPFVRCAEPPMDVPAAGRWGDAVAALVASGRTRAGDSLLALDAARCAAPTLIDATAAD